MVLLGPILYFFTGAVAVIVAGLVYRSYLQSKNGSFFYLSIGFLCIALHALALSVPALINPADLHSIAVGYIVGIAAVYLLLITSVRVEILMGQSFLKKYLFALSASVGIVGVFVIALMLYDFRLPIIDSSGLIFWNGSPIASWFTGLLSLVYGSFWCLMFFQSGAFLKSGIKRAKIFVLGIDGLFFGLAALLVFTSVNVLQTLIGLSLFVFAAVATLIVLVLT